MFFLVTIFAKGDQALHVLALLADDRFSIKVVGFVMDFQPIVSAAPLATVAVPQSYETTHLAPVVRIEDTSVLTLPSPLVLQSRH